MTDRELFRQALDALEEISGGYSQNLIVALRERLAQAEQPSDLDWWKARAIQAERLVEKFGQPEQEPVAKWDASAPLVVHPHPAFQAAPPQRKPLSDEDMKLLWAKHGYKSAMCKPFARAIEAAHGIKGKA